MVIVSDWREQEVRNESRSRDRNEWIAETRGAVALEHETEEDFVCECSDAACRSRIHLTRLEYEAVRGYPTRFAIATDHENPEVDQLVSEGQSASPSCRRSPAARRASPARRTTATATPS